MFCTQAHRSPSPPHNVCLQPNCPCQTVCPRWRTPAARREAADTLFYLANSTSCSLTDNRRRPSSDLFPWYLPWTFQPQSHSVYISPSRNASVASPAVANGPHSARRVFLWWGSLDQVNVSNPRICSAEENIKDELFSRGNILSPTHRPSIGGTQGSGRTHTSIYSSFLNACEFKGVSGHPSNMGHRLKPRTHSC